MKNMSIDIVACTETGSPGLRQSGIEDYYAYYAGEVSPDHLNRTAIILHKRIKNTILGYLPISDTVAILNFKAAPHNLNRKFRIGN